MSIDENTKIVNAHSQLTSCKNPQTNGVRPRAGRELLQATRPFAEESRVRSWWHVGTVFTLLVASSTGAALGFWWPLRVVLSCIAALLLLRSFITYHDYMHGAILPDSRIAAGLFHLYAALVLVPASSWKKSHNHHHGHVGKTSSDCIGSFPLITTKAWISSSWIKRLTYRIQRHPLIIFFGYITIFAFSICLEPLLRNPTKHTDSLIAIVAHSSLVTLLWVFGGADVAFFVVLLPMFIACMIGSYLFFAQHSFKDMTIIPADNWTYNQASLESSSYMKMNKLMAWFTGNIGYHHIHHLNVRIPFYRLPHAMAAIPELQTPAITSLSFRDIVDCFRSNLWDEDTQRVVSFREAKRSLVG